MRLWGGRFSGQTNEAAAHFNSSISFDMRLYKQDIIGSIAHARMLGRQGIIPVADSEKITGALAEILADIENGALEIDQQAEDIHSFVEAELIKRIGDAGRRLHTGRSRNDQVALDMRMYVLEEIDSLNALLVNLLNALLATSKAHYRSIMPGLTHLQKAQPITLGHHLMAYFQMFKRDYRRLANCRQIADEMPLGSGALAATVYPIDREYVREQLGFSAITENSLDAVSDRDFCVELLACLSIIMMHLSRFCEELILWTTDSVGFIEISDAYTTGSSIMPQKKNPDMAELIRGKTGRVYGSLMGVLTLLKGLPLAYNKDMQEDKEAVFDAVDTVKSCLVVFCGMFENITFNTAAMQKSAKGGYTNATDAADWLVKKGVPFRNAHEITGKLVLYAIEQGKPLEELTLAELRLVSDIFDADIFDHISLNASVNARNVTGGPGEGAMLEAIGKARKFLEEI
ncbi:MAG: argininosuccinate lyase [Defluviitaleaceae bacterium]|nr:argininosuccinate lyase [Defluviitaleaceae bacterium]